MRKFRPKYEKFRPEYEKDWTRIRESLDQTMRSFRQEYAAFETRKKTWDVIGGSSDDNPASIQSRALSLGRQCVLGMY